MKNNLLFIGVLLVLFLTGFNPIALIESKDKGENKTTTNARAYTVIGGFDLNEAADLVISLDYNNDTKEDVICYRPGKNKFFLNKAESGNTFRTVIGSHYGIPGFDLNEPNDRIISLDYDGDDNDDIMVYRPGNKLGWIYKSDGSDANTFERVYFNDNSRADNQGYQGYDLKSPDDKIIAIDYNGDGKDEILCYRPGTGHIFMYSNPFGTPNFFPVLAFWHGLGEGTERFDLNSTFDRIITLDYNGDNKEDLLMYRPGSRIWYLFKSTGTGQFVFENKGTTGIAGYDLSSIFDRLVAIDYDNDGDDDVMAYRPGGQKFFLLRSNRDGTFTPRVQSHGGVMGYDLKSGYDKIIAVNYRGDKSKPGILCYRPGSNVAFWGHWNGSSFVRDN